MIEFSPNPKEGWQEIGEGVKIAFVRYTDEEKAPDPAGIMVQHDNPMCEAPVMWWNPEDADRETWELKDLQPLTLEPSVQCALHPEFHGHIKEGKWHGVT